MKLKDIIKDLKIKKISGQIDLEIEDIVYDSQKAVDKTLFAALIGMTSDLSLIHISEPTRPY